MSKTLADQRLTETQMEAWRVAVSDVLDRGIDAAKNVTRPPSESAWFFNSIKEPNENTSIVPIKWNAFPRRLLNKFSSKTMAWRMADSSRNAQEEYCEWEVVRDKATDKVKRVTFTTEVPEYYAFLFEHAPEQLLELYRTLVSEDVELYDLKNALGKYNPRNVWNYPETKGQRGVLLHMGNYPNTLTAAVILAAEATWPSVDSAGKLITDEQGLIECRRFGAPERHSDPHIGAQVNSAVRSGHKVSFASPAGVFIDDIDLSGFETPDDADIGAFVRVVRGDADHKVRVIFESPPEVDYLLGDVKIDGSPIRFGGQIAEKLTIRIDALTKAATNVAPSIACRGKVAGSDQPAFNSAAARRQHEEFILSPE
ncbi:hypothetical protein [Pseudomonas fluorescens]|uniref:hypothetical protein n=1 Tax=Pseudomonas fluorescens TaxID=294 RepID=UPI001A9FD4E4|nr:hypothetical protein [Pseudomonas fluorescens]QTD31468.1 hypothetical protein JZM58_19460 [Pseudomonas fluorescens]